MYSIEKEKPDSFTIRGPKTFGMGEAEPLVFERVGTTGALYVAKYLTDKEADDIVRRYHRAQKPMSIKDWMLPIFLASLVAYLVYVIKT